jgi:hypothetical protein
MRGKRTGLFLVLLILFALRFILSFRYFQQFQRVKIGKREIRINLKAKIDPEKTYHLRLWDYDWPLLKSGYREYLLGAIAEFKKTYPNINVEIRLMDLLTGSKEFSKALEAGRPPDLYCSTFDIPQFDFRYQIPVGPFVDRNVEKPLYFKSLTRLVTRENVQCFFPRWARLKIWIGNPALLARVGLDPKQLQEEGWNWEAIFNSAVKLPQGHYPLVGNLLPNRLVDRLLSDEDGSEWQLVERIKERCKFPAGFHSDMAGHFMTGRAMVLAGVQPIVFRKLREIQQQQSMRWEAVCLPAPVWEKAAAAGAVDLGVIGVYRQRYHGGDERVAAAVKLAEFLSVYPVTIPWEELMVVPAARKAALIWSQNVSAAIGDVSPVVRALDRLRAAGRAEDNESGLERVNAFHDYLLGKITRQEFQAGNRIIK